MNIKTIGYTSHFLIVVHDRDTVIHLKLSASGAASLFDDLQAYFAKIAAGSGPKRKALASGLRVF